MAGIRVDNPVGTNWEYSLDQLSWQSSPRFSQRGPGVPFVVDTIYTVYCRNQVDELTAKRQIVFGIDSSDSLLNRARLLSPELREAFIRILFEEIQPETWALLAAHIAGAFTAEQFEIICQGITAIGCGGGGNGSDDDYYVLQLLQSGCFSPVSGTGGSLTTGSVATEHLQAGAVTPETTSFLYTGLNHFNNKDKRNRANTYRDENGNLKTSRAFILSHPMKVDPGTEYVCNSVQIVSFFDSKRNYLGCATAPRDPVHFTTPPTCAYVEANIPTQDLNNYQFERGRIGTGFKSFRQYIDAETATGDRALAISRAAFQLARSIYGKFSVGTNKYDKRGLAVLENFFLDDEDQLHSDADYSVSEFIGVKPNIYYTPNYREYVTFYNWEGEPIGGVRYDRATFRFKTPKTCAFVRCTVGKDQRNNFQLVEGEEDLPFEEYQATLNAETPQGTRALAEAYQSELLHTRLSFATVQLFWNNHPDNRPGEFMTDLGVLGTNDQLTLSHFIKVKPGQWYRPFDTRYVTFFDEARRPLRTGAAYDRRFVEFQANEKTHYVRLTIATKDKDVYMLQEGKIQDNTVPFSPLLDVLTPQGNQNAQSIVAANNTLNMLTDKIKEVGENIFNVDDTENNKSDTFVDTNGTFYSGFAGQTVTHLMPVEGNDFITLLPPIKAGACCYDENEQPIPSDAGAYNRKTSYFQVPEQTRFIRVNVPTAQKNLFMVVRGVTPPARYKAYSTTPKYNTVLTVKSDIVGNVYGTSIDIQGRHFEIMTESLGWTLNNHAVAASMARISNKDGSYTNMSYYARYYAWSATLAEKDALIANFTAIKPTLNQQFFIPDSLDAAEIAKIRSTSYESNLTPYLDGRKPLPNIFYITHAFNDQPYNFDVPADWYTLPDNPLDRRTYIGAMNYILDHIYSLQPDANVVIIGHYREKDNENAIAGQAFIAKRHSLPRLKLHELMGLSDVVVPNTKHLWAEDPYKNFTAGQDTSKDMTRFRLLTPDGTHWETDPYLRAARKAAGLLEGFSLPLV